MKSKSEMSLNGLQTVLNEDRIVYGDYELYENALKIRMDDRNFVPVTMNKSRVSALVDSGADQCTLSAGMLKHVFGNDSPPKMHKSQFSHVLLADGRRRVRILGKALIKFDIGGKCSKNIFLLRRQIVSQ